jgi:hypothetical protein
MDFVGFSKFSVSLGYLGASLSRPLAVAYQLKIDLSAPLILLLGFHRLAIIFSQGNNQNLAAVMKEHGSQKKDTAQRSS